MAGLTDSDIKSAGLTLWCIGSSIVRWAQFEALQRPGGPDLGLDRLNLKIWWQGYSGLKIRNLDSKITLNTPSLFSDGVHLSTTGNNIFLNGLQERY
ncbi:uncharacterized protein [Argopecten irradians]|uniref:uncharacterized protein n=1 Tax=Argopecten irradians TaxID=31199 RepID=UPI0037208E19